MTVPPALKAQKAQILNLNRFFIQTKLMILKVTETTQISTKKTVIDAVNFLLVEDAITAKHKMLEKILISGDKKKQILLTNQAMLHAVLFVSPFITGLMTAHSLTPYPW